MRGAFEQSPLSPAAFAQLHRVWMHRLIGGLSLGPVLRVHDAAGIHLCASYSTLCISAGAVLRTAICLPAMSDVVMCETTGDATAQPEEQAAHVAFLAEVLKDRSLWSAYGVGIEEAAAA